MGDEFLGGLFLGPVFLCWKLGPMPTSGSDGYTLTQEGLI